MMRRWTSASSSQLKADRKAECPSQLKTELEGALSADSGIAEPGTQTVGEPNAAQPPPAASKPPAKKDGGDPPPMLMGSP